MTPKFFPTPKSLRAWLAKNHTSVDMLIVGLHKKESGKRSVTWPELVDQLLCFGWIDGVRRSIDESSYSIRITPRRPGSFWSAVNVKRAKELIELGLMEPSGKAVFDARDEKKTNQYSYERESAALGPDLEAIFKTNEKAWKFWEVQSPSYRKLVSHWVTSAKREETRLRRLGTLMEDSANGVRIGPLRRE